MKRMDLTKMSNQLIVAGMTAMVEDDGLTPHEALEVVRDIQKNIFHGLAEIHREVTHGKDHDSI